VVLEIVGEPNPNTPPVLVVTVLMLITCAIESEEVINMPKMNKAFLI
jgi:hypothetical protein